jgi:hypothetical protein
MRPITLADRIYLLPRCHSVEREFCRAFGRVWRKIPAIDRRSILQYARNGTIQIEVLDELTDPESGKFAWGLTSKKGFHVAFSAPRMAEIIEKAEAGLLEVLIAHELGHVYRWAVGKHHPDRDKEEVATNRLAADWGFDRSEWTATFAEQVVDGPAQACGEGAQGPRLAAFLLPACQPALGRLAGAQEQGGRLGEGPLEVGVADLVPSGAFLLAGRLVGAAHQPGVGQELAGGAEAADVVDLVEQDQGQDGADAGDRAQPLVGLRVVHLGRPRQVQLQGTDLLVVGADQGQVGLGAVAHGGVGEAGGHVQFLAVGSVAELLGERRQVVLTVGVDQVGQ